MNKETKRFLFIITIGFIPLLSCGSSSSITNDEGNPTDGTTTGQSTAYVTSATGLYSLTKIKSDMISESGSPGADIELVPSQTYQTMDGFGAAITYSTAYNLLKMSQADARPSLIRMVTDSAMLEYLLAVLTSLARSTPVVILPELRTSDCNLMTSIM
jgi:glucosylceramidase